MKNLFIVALLATGSQAMAATIVDQPLDSVVPGMQSNLGPSNQQVADDFSVTGLISLGLLTWSGRYESAIGTVDPTDFSIRIFSDSGGSPGLPQFVTIAASVSPVDSGLDFGGSPWFTYSYDLGGVILGSGTYWISIVETDASTTPGGSGDWRWGESVTFGDRATRTSDGVPFNVEQGLDLAFRLETQAVPEPSTWLLLGTGLAFAAYRRRRQG